VISGLTKDDEEVAFASILEIVSHMQISIHARLEHGDAAKFVELRSMGLVGEGAGDQHIEVSIRSLAGGGYQVGA
jgi:hypothetical protein